MSKNTNTMLNLTTDELVGGIKLGSEAAVTEANRRLAKGVKAKNRVKLQNALSFRRNETEMAAEPEAPKAAPKERTTKATTTAKLSKDQRKLVRDQYWATIAEDPDTYGVGRGKDEQTGAQPGARKALWEAIEEAVLNA